MSDIMLDETKLIEDEFRGAMRDPGYVMVAEDSRRVYTFHWGRLSVDFTGAGDWAVLNLLSSCCNHAIRPPGATPHWSCAGCSQTIDESEVDRRNGYWFEVRDERLETWLAATYPRWSPLQLAVAHSYLADLMAPYIEES